MSGRSRGRSPITSTSGAPATARRLMRRRHLGGSANTSMSMIAPQVRGYTKDVEKRWPNDIPRAKKLMAEAGYPTGFDVTLDPGWNLVSVELGKSVQTKRASSVEGLQLEVFGR